MVDRILPYVRSRQRQARFNRLAQLRGMNRTMTRQRTQTDGIGVSQHYDSRLIYRKKRMPRYRRNRWKRFSRKVQFVAEKDWGTQQIVFNTLVNPYNYTNGKQLVKALYLYPLFGSVDCSHDLYTIGNNFLNADDTPSKGLAVGLSSKVFFQSAVLDLTIRNTSTQKLSGNSTMVSAAKLEVDIYELTQRESSAKDATTYGTFENELATNIGSTYGVGGAAAEIDYDKRGVTPFDLSYCLSHFGLKIWKKTKFTISNGDQITFQVRDPRRHVISLSDMTESEGFNRPKLTKIIFIVAKLAPGLYLDTTEGNFTEGLNIGVTRKYTCKIENYSEDRTLYLTN